MIIDSAPKDLLTELRAADAAARAARAVPGVVRLQPGVWGLVRQLAAQAWEQATGQQLPDIAGVDAELADDGTLGVALHVVVGLGHQVSAVGCAVQAVGCAVQDAVSVAVAAELDRPVTAVTVHVVEVDLPIPPDRPPPATWPGPGQPCAAHIRAAVVTSVARPGLSRGGSCADPTTI